MAAVMKYYIGPSIPKNKKAERSLWINSFKCLFWAKDSLETDMILFTMLVMAYSHPMGKLYK